MTLIDAAARALGVTAADAGLRTAILVGVVAMILAIWRRPSARMRLWAWSLVLYGAIAMPLVARVLPPEGISVPPSAQAVFRTVPELIRSPFTRAVESSPIAPSTRSPATAGAPAFPIGVVLLVAYALVAATMLARLVAGWFVAVATARRGVRIGDAAVCARAGRHARALGLRTSPRIVEHGRCAVPMTLGLRDPLVVLPPDWREWPPATVDAVLVHELSHVARADVRTLGLARVYRAVGWANPAAWWLHARLADFAERASDDAVLEAGIDAASYAAMLATFGTRAPWAGGPLAGVVTMARRGAATERRIDRVLNRTGFIGGDVMARIRTTQVTMAAIVAVVVAAAATAHIDARIVPAPLPIAGVAAPLAGSSPLTLAPLALSPPANVRFGPNPGDVRQGPPPAIAQGFGAGAYRSGGPDWSGYAVTNPVMLHQVAPAYTRAALDRKLEGNVEFEAIILPDGTVGPMRVTHSLDRETGLDDQAARAVRQWTFKPGVFKSEPVAVLVGLVVEFRIASSTKVDGSAGRYVPQPMDDAFAKGAYWVGETGVTAPVVVHQVDPKYTGEALRQRIDGVVQVELVVMPDGSVGPARVVRSLDPIYGLDDQALAAVKDWIFTPGHLSGTVVPVLTTVDLYFRIH